MKKHGFTLAEVLVTLGIIGVITAVTLPTFTSNMAIQKTGPMLGKAVNTFESATREMLTSQEKRSLAECTFTKQKDGGNKITTADFYTAIGKYLKGGATADKKTFITADGISYELAPETDKSNSEFPKDHNFGSVIVKLDQNEGTYGKNQFLFQLRGDGSLVAEGSTQIGGETVWTTKCAKGATVSKDDAKSCTGHVMENNLKIEYNLSNK